MCSRGPTFSCPTNKSDWAKARCTLDSHGSHSARFSTLPTLASICSCIAWPPSSSETNSSTDSVFSNHCVSTSGLSGVLLFDFSKSLETCLYLPIYSLSMNLNTKQKRISIKPFFLPVYKSLVINKSIFLFALFKFNVTELIRFSNSMKNFPRHIFKWITIFNLFSIFVNCHQKNYVLNKIVYILIF